MSEIDDVLQEFFPDGLPVSPTVEERLQIAAQLEKELLESEP